MKISDFIIEGGGYIPQTDKEAHDPRWEMALTCDIKPGEDRRQAAKFNFKVGKNGPPHLRSNGKIFEALTLKLSKPNPKVQAAIDAIYEKFPENPMSPTKRLFYVGGEPIAYFEVSPHENNLRIRDIHVLKPMHGVGSILLRRILKIADQFGVTVDLTASPYGDDPDRISKDKLVAWYKKHGFEDEEKYDPSLGYLIRKPTMEAKEQFGKYTKKSDFRFKGGAMLMQRFGPINAQKQDYKTSHKAPAGRGLWAFPYPAFDMFFAYHKVNDFLPNDLTNEYIQKVWDARMKAEAEGDDELAKKYDETVQSLHDLRAEAIKKIEHKIKPKTFWWDGPVYSHIAPKGKHVDGQSWYLWTDLKAFAKEANKSMVSFASFAAIGMKPNIAEKGFPTYSVDHLEVFLPQKAELTKKAKARQ